jgi:ankyrin repeat protein
LYVAALAGHEHVVRCLVKDCGNGSTPLIAAAERKHTEVVVWLTKHGADSQVLHDKLGTAADISRFKGAPAAKPGCSGVGLEKGSYTVARTVK